jgi:hypothetical protein
VVSVRMGREAVLFFGGKTPELFYERRCKDKKEKNREQETRNDWERMLGMVKQGEKQLWAGGQTAFFLFSLSRRLMASDDASAI